MKIDVVEHDDSLVLTVEGDLDMSTAGLLAEQLERAEASDARTIVVDLDKVGFMDSVGLHVLLQHGVTSHDDGQRLRLRLTEGSPQVRRVFELTGVLDHLPFLAD